PSPISSASTTSTVAVPIAYKSYFTPTTTTNNAAGASTANSTNMTPTPSSVPTWLSEVRGKPSVLSFMSVTESVASLKEVAGGRQLTSIMETQSLQSRSSFVAEKVELTGGNGRDPPRIVFSLNKPYQCLESGYSEEHAEYPCLTRDEFLACDVGDFVMV
ncbi:UNVERIFIED_CONTAM: hypothetical protein HDU68_012517, partial [Siphonaria sp. JEL0065]